MGRASVDRSVLTMATTTSWVVSEPAPPSPSRPIAVPTGSALHQHTDPLPLELLGGH